MIRFVCVALALCSVATAGEKPGKAERMERKIQRLENKLAAMKRRDDAETRKDHEWWKGRKGDPWRNPTSSEINDDYDQLFPRDIIPAGD